MSTENKRRKRLKLFLFKIPLIVMVICAVLLGALKMVERYPEPLRQGFEEYLSKSTGRNATIGQLKQIKFFPTVIFEAENITLHNSANAALIDLEIKRILFEAPFVSMFLRTGKFNNFELEELQTLENFISPKAIHIASIAINNKKGPDQFGTFLEAVGKIGDAPFSSQTQLEAGTYHYKMNTDAPFSLSVEKYDVSSSLERKLQSVVLKNLVFKNENNQAEGRNYFLYNDGKYQENNPLHCLVMVKDLTNCDQYLTKEN